MFNPVLILVMLPVIGISANRRPYYLKNGYAFMFDLPLTGVHAKPNKTSLNFNPRPSFVSSVMVRDDALYFEGVTIDDEHREINLTIKVNGNKVMNSLLSFTPIYTDPSIDGCNVVPAAVLTFSRDLDFSDRAAYLRVMKAVSTEFNYPLDFIKVVSERNVELEPRTGALKLSLMAPDADCISTVGSTLDKELVVSSLNSLNEFFLKGSSKNFMPGSPFSLQIVDFRILVNYAASENDHSTPGVSTTELPAEFSTVLFPSSSTLSLESETTLSHLEHQSESGSYSTLAAVPNEQMRDPRIVSDFENSVSEHPDTGLNYEMNTVPGVFSSKDGTSSLVTAVPEQKRGPDFENAQPEHHGIHFDNDEYGRDRENPDFEFNAYHDVGQGDHDQQESVITHADDGARDRSNQTTTSTEKMLLPDESSSHNNVHQEPSLIDSPLSNEASSVVTSRPEETVSHSEMRTITSTLEQEVVSSTWSEPTTTESVPTTTERVPTTSPAEEPTTTERAAETTTQLAWTTRLSTTEKNSTITEVETITTDTEASSFPTPTTSRPTLSTDESLIGINIDGDEEARDGLHEADGIQIDETEKASSAVAPVLIVIVLLVMGSAGAAFIIMRVMKKRSFVYVYDVNTLSDSILQASFSRTMDFPPEVVEIPEERSVLLGEPETDQQDSQV